MGRGNLFGSVYGLEMVCPWLPAGAWSYCGGQGCFGVLWFERILGRVWSSGRRRAELFLGRNEGEKTFWPLVD